MESQQARMLDDGQVSNNLPDQPLPSLIAPFCSSRVPCEYTCEDVAAAESVWLMPVDQNGSASDPLVQGMC